MLDRATIEGRPNGITYLVRGDLKNDFIELVDLVNGICNTETPEGISTKAVLARLKILETDVEELVAGMNKIWEVLVQRGIVGEQ